MRLTSRDNLSQVMADIDQFARSISDVAAPRALNALRDQAQTAGLREVAKVYGIGPRTMEQARYLRTTTANATNPQASIEVGGKSFEPSVYRPVQTSAGTVVTIKGKRVLLPHAFIVKAFGGRVFARGGFGGIGQATGQQRYGFTFGKRRFPIASPFTLRPSHVFGAQTVTDAMDARVAEQAPKILAREIAAARRGF